MTEFKTVRYGDRGTFVELLQLGLNRAGFLQASPDGIFGTNTVNAVKNFQRANSLNADGVAGPRTWNALRSYLTGYVKHTIRNGDTFYKLSRAYGTTVRAIETANPTLLPLNLTIGAQMIIPRQYPVVSPQIATTPTYLALCLEGLGARYPFLHVNRVGRSEMGKPLYAVDIGAGSNHVFYNATHHANEWITSTLLMTYLENLARAYASEGTIFGESAESLYNMAMLHVMPMVNPDGVSLVTGELDSGAYFDNAYAISKNYPAIAFPDGWKANIVGVDPNLQYPAGWSEARDIKFAQGYVSPAPRDYVGAAPLEIPESRAVYSYTQAHNFSLTLSYHTQGRVIYWKYLDYMPKNSLEIGQRFASVSGYTLELTPAASAYAGYKDWFISAYNRPGYTIEAGVGIAPLPLSQFDTIYAENEGILTLGLVLAPD